MKPFLIIALLVLYAASQQTYTQNVVNLITQGANLTQQSSRAASSCVSGYYWSGQTCMPCAQLTGYTTTGNAVPGYYKCVSYAQAGDLICNSGFTLLKGYCLQIPVGCVTYGLNPAGNSLICQSCATNYTLISGVCIANNNCTQYNSQTGICSACASGYFFAWDLQYQPSTNNQWSLYYLNSQSFCQRCGITNCTSCPSAYTCTTCAANFYWLPSTATTTASTTTSGAGNYGTCAACMTGCANCTSSTTCTQCQTGYYLVSATGTGTPSCTLCSTGVTNCAACSSATTCTACAGGYYLYSSSQCVQLGNFCKTATPTVNCTSCQTGYLLDTSLNQCVACPAGCTACTFLSGTSGTLTCSACQDLYYGVKNSTTNQTTCSLCSSANQQWLRCNGPVENPQLSAAQPTQCVNGYYLVSTGDNTAPTCIQSQQSNPCLTAAPSATTLTCSACVTGYNLYTGGQCLSCPPQAGATSSVPTGCNQCTTSGTLTCTGCMTGYYFSGSGTAATCIACSTGCATCTSGGCSQCRSGFYLTGTSCAACVSNCISCSSATSCSTCATGFFLTSTGTGTTQTSACYACQPGCSTCASPGQTCSACLTTTTGSSSYVNQNQGCVQLNEANCFTATSTGCSICNYGFYFQNNYCLQCIQPYAGFVCNQTQTTNGVTPTPSSNGYLLSVLALLVLFVGF